MEQELFHNAYSLCIDACILYDSKSFATAFALAVLAYEELGKLHLLDHVNFENLFCDPIVRRMRFESLFSGKLAYNHIVKQRWALSLTKDGYSDLYNNGRLDHLKQAAFYVGFRNGRIRVPDRISARTAYNQIKRVVRLFGQTKDLPFIQHFEDSTPDTRAISAPYLSSALRALNALKKPKPGVKPQ